MHVFLKIVKSSFTEMTNQIYILKCSNACNRLQHLVIDYDSVKIEFPKHGNRLHHEIIDYKSEIEKNVSMVIDYIMR